jgi:hypothetical protein
VIYLLLLRYVAPSREPYFILGTAVVGLVSWLCGGISGLVTALILIPVTTGIYEQFSISTSYSSVASTPANIAMQIITAVSLGILRKNRNALAQRESELSTANERMRTKLADVQEPGGLHNLCSSCKSIQEKDGSWKDVAGYLKVHTKMEFSHCICPQCAEQFHDPDPVQPD